MSYKLNPRYGHAILVNLLAGVWLPSWTTPYRRAYAHTNNTAKHNNHEKINSWVFFSFLHVYGALPGGPLDPLSSAIKLLTDIVSIWIFFSSAEEITRLRKSKKIRLPFRCLLMTFKKFTRPMFSTRISSWILEPCKNRKTNLCPCSYCLWAHGPVKKFKKNKEE